MRIVEPSASYEKNPENMAIVKSMVVDKLKGKLNPVELRTLFKAVDFPEIYSMWKCQDSAALYKFIKSKVGTPVGVVKAERVHDGYSLFEFDEAEAFYSSKERRTL